MSDQQYPYGQPGPQQNQGQPQQPAGQPGPQQPAGQPAQQTPYGQPAAQQNFGQRRVIHAYVHAVGHQEGAFSLLDQSGLGDDVHTGLHTCGSQQQDGTEPSSQISFSHIGFFFE